MVGQSKEMSRARRAVEAFCRLYARHGKDRRVFSVESIIGGGKTTLSRRLRSKFPELLVFDEDVPMELLNLFYGDPGKYAFALQMFMMACSSKAMLVHNEGRVVFIDRCVLGNAAFAVVNADLGNMTEAEFVAYLGSVLKCVTLPSVVFFLDLGPGECEGRMVERGRGCEVNGGVSSSYQQAIMDATLVILEELERRGHIELVRVKESAQAGLEECVVDERIKDAFEKE